MAIYCPIIKDNVLYLDCKDCDDTTLCRQLKLCGTSEAINKDKPNLGRENEGDINYEKDC